MIALEKQAIEILHTLSEKGQGQRVFFEEDLNYIRILLNLIQKQATEINKLNNVIDKLVKRIKYDTEWFYSDLDNKSEEEIKEYFMKEDK